MLAEADIRQPQIFSNIGNTVKMWKYTLELHKKGLQADGIYEVALNDRSISCFFSNHGVRVHVPSATLALLIYLESIGLLLT